MSRLKKHYKNLRLILGDQLNSRHSWFQEASSDTVYVIAEFMGEANYVVHHKQKLAGFFLAMSNFAEALKKSDHHVCHLTLDSDLYQQNEFSNLKDLVLFLAEKYACETISYQRPDEWRLLNQLRDLPKAFDGDVHECDTEHFLLVFDELSDWLEAGKHNRMEYFYRAMRKHFDVLMDDGKPQGDQWNFDHDNRQSFKQNDIDAVPDHMQFDSDISDVKQRIIDHKVKTLGEWPANDQLPYPAGRRQSLCLLREFCQQRLSQFGRFQDAMTASEEAPYGLYHSRLSFSLNTKMISPKEVIDAAVEAWQQDPEAISLAQVEGFVRQILGWREYVRAFYWVNGKQYREHNFFKADNALPDYFWTGETGMACVKHSVNLSLDYSYAHHIQRLMVTGNLALLLGVNPDEVDDWYLGIYMDAIEWVQQPNTRGMSQFADGGWLATKPYVSSGNYINKMSDYCKNCSYDVKQTTGDKACPFNSLYWHFLMRHRDKLGDNPRMKLIYSALKKKSSADQKAIEEWADKLIAKSNQL